MPDSRDNLRALAARAQLVREEEAARIARELHDVLGQALTGLKLDAAWIERRLPAVAVSDEAARPLVERLRSMSATIDGTIKNIRRLCTELRPAFLDDLGLVAAIEWQAREFEQRTGVQVSLQHPPGDLLIPRDVATALFRIFQELLTNVARHANAHEVQVAIEVGANQVTLTVKDDGRGITEKEKNDPHAMGLLGMHERALAVNGTLRVDGVPDGGTTARVAVPLVSPAASSPIG